LETYTELKMQLHAFLIWMGWSCQASAILSTYSFSFYIIIIYNLQKAAYFLYNKSKEFNLEIATNKTKVFGFVGTDHLRAKIVINDETLEQVNQFTYLGCILSYQCSNDVEFKLAKFLQLIGTIKKTIFKKVRT